MSLPRHLPWLPLVLLLLPFAAGAQGVPSEASAPRAVEVEVQAGDGGTSISSEDARRLGLVTDGGEAPLVPPVLLADSPAAWPEGLEGTPGEVTLELLVDEQGAVAEVKVVQAPSEPRLAEAAQKAAPGLRFQPATLGGVAVSVRLPFVYRFEPPPPPAPVRVRLSGEVRARGTRRPLADAALFIDGEATPAATTDAQGRFTLEVPPGAHRIEVRSPGHLPATFEETLAPGQTLQVVYRLQPGVVNPYETVVRDDKPRTEVTRFSLHEQEIREVPGTQGDPFRVVMLMPGVGSLASGVSYPVVRGSQPAATGFFLDGVRIPMLYHLLLGPAVVHPDFIDTVDFYPGTPSVQYGRLLGGVVEGRLSRPREDRLHATVYADFINAGGFVEYPFASTGTSISVAGRISYTALLISTMANVLNLAEDANRTRAGFWDYQARIEQKVGKGRLRLFALGSSDDVGLSPDEKVLDSAGGGVFQRFHRVDLRGTYPVEGGELEAGITVGLDGAGLIGDETRVIQEQQQVVRVGEYRMDQALVSARAGWRQQLGQRLELRMGGDVEHRRAAVVLRGTGVPPGTRPGDPSDPLKSPSTLTTFSGAFAELTWNPSERWTLVPGVRVDAYHLVPGLTFTGVEPRLTVRHALSETLTLKGGAGLFHQPPTVLLHLPVLDSAGLRYGLQEGVQMDVGAEWRPFDGLELSADAFYNPLSRTVEFDLAEVAENRRRASVSSEDPSESGYAYGFELMARHPLGRQWFGWVSYSFLQSKRRVRFDRYDDNNRVLSSGEATLPFAFEQAHVLNTALSYKFGNNYTVGAVVHFNTGRPESGEITSHTQRVATDPQGNVTWVRADGDRLGRLPPFFRVDLRAAKSWAKDDYTLDLSLDILNVSVQSEVYGYTYGFDEGGGLPERRAIKIPLVLPMLGLKGTY
ncbi:TonB-dependent receptor domain-containing protein [Hyalangium rubrum]|uniref:TonB-dependent receptor n=1 Tax=Hyalangium rubrum TaxID=3103134 RepID=A0ABU5GWW6_9BACT|nr:TonB-dependent receptor [Hyalangium sp. s54d21]MDY7225679.1 TonB-dependent receptor [Hyalangium sp. s54d21]